MKLLVTGAEGQLGWELLQQNKDQAFDIVGVNQQRLDITNTDQIEEIFTAVKPDLVINCAAYTAVDQAEEEEAIAFSANCTGAENLAQACKSANIPMVHTSTDYVFDGMKTEPYHENDPANPCNVYGKTKLQGEVAIKEQLDQHIIVRLSGVFGINGHNFVKTILKLAKQYDQLRIVADQTVCPTPTTDIANMLLTIAKTIRTDPRFNAWGTYHFTSNEPITWHGFASAILEHAQSHYALKAQEIVAITTDEYPALAKRPKYSVLACDKIANQFAIATRSWREELVSMLSRTML